MPGRPRSVAVAAALAVATLAGGTIALATHEEGHTIVSGDSVTAVTAVADPGSQFFEGGAGVQNVEGSAVKMHVPAGEQAFFLATFQAESECEAADASGAGECYVFVHMGGAESGDLNPVDDDTIFDSAVCIGPSSCPGDGAEAHAIHRSTDILGPGTYTFRVGTFSTGDVTFRIDDWHFTVERVNV